MRFAHRSILALSLALAGCSGSSPTAPTPPPVTVIPPPAPPVVVTPAPGPALDSRYSRAFYLQMALNGLESPQALSRLRRQTQAPRIYLRTVDDTGRVIDAQTLNETAAALIAVTGKLTGVFGLAGLERGTDTRIGQHGWITVMWSATLTGTLCASAFVGGDQMTIFYRRGGSCRCAGGGAIKPLIVKHEMGHALGFYHTDSVSDLMHNGGQTACDQEPSAREVYHASIAYQMPLGSLDP